MHRLLPWLLVTVALAADTDLDERGWHHGTVAANTAQILTPIEAVELTLPVEVASRIQRTTFLYYFSPTCGHCQATIPEVVRLQHEIGDRVDFLGVSVAGVKPAQIEEFRKTYLVSFPIIQDTPDRAFGTAIGARGTPTVLVVEPRDGKIFARDAYYPWGQGLSLVAKLSLWPDDPFAQLAPGVYQGPRACGACHENELRSWGLSHHAVAYRNLYLRDRAEDPKCVGCHVTGMGEPTGFVMGDHGSILTGVTCEACHGPGGPHDGSRMDARTACASCHDADHSIAFSLEKGLPHIDHFAADGLSEAEMEARWQALVGGQAERPLLAFPDGANVGVAACVSCHPDQVKAWERSAHGKAMAALDRKDREEVSCVRCHATANKTGPMASPTLADFRVSEGVGCESCHGPGEQHVASPSKANILGLGATCPECVIEEVCTSCHTPEQDAKWNLDKRLSAVKGHGP